VRPSDEVGEARRDELARTPGTRVVVTGDHAMSLGSVARPLRDDYSISAVGDGQTAAAGVAFCRTKLPDVFIVDHHLPDPEAPTLLEPSPLSSLV
jgi:DNA-binding NarL/FixJ family response regulator